MSTVDPISDSVVNCDNNTSNYALQLALKTMQERCQQLQKRLASVEDENCNLKMRYCKEKQLIQPDASNKSEIDVLKDRIALLLKQKSQLAQNIMMVAAENRNLWSRLSKLTDVNNSLGNKLVKINDTLNQHKIDSRLSPIPTSTHLIRSKTFTQHAPRERLEKNEGANDSELISLEEISLKLMDRLLKEKADLEEQCAQMTEIQNEVEIDVTSFGFTYPDSVEADISINELTKHSEKLHSLKEALLLQQHQLRTLLETVQKLYKENGKVCDNCIQKKDEQIQSTNFPNKISDVAIEDRRVCPMCGKLFFNISITSSMQEFQTHVESHFVDEDDSVTDNFEIVTHLGT